VVFGGAEGARKKFLHWNVDVRLRLLGKLLLSSVEFLGRVEEDLMGIRNGRGEGLCCCSPLLLREWIFLE